MPETYKGSSQDNQMRSLSVIIPSKTLSNFLACRGAVTQFDPEAKVLLINDGVEPLPMVELIPGVKPFCFARNVNLGIVARQDDDVVVLNDDATLQTPGGFSLLQRAAEEHPEFGIISATTNITGNPAQQRLKSGNPSYGLREEKNSVAFIAVLVPRRAIDKVGLMDERFGGLTAAGKRIYGFCDNDYCRRVRNAGLKVGVHDGCFVDHGSLRSSFRGEPGAAGDISEGRKLYIQKWGDAH